MISEVIRDAEERMHKGVDALRREYATIRAGRANPSVLDKVMVEYYGAPTPVSQLANISAPEARMLVIQAWDRTILPAIEKAIMKSDLGLNPSSDGIVIRLNIPQLTAERRVELVKKVKKEAEEARVSIRNVRRDVNDKLKRLEKDHEASEDIENVVETKENEITEV
jgi:ribosome recycling factor